MYIQIYLSLYNNIIGNIFHFLIHLTHDDDIKQNWKLKYKLIT